jgi:nitronate monooxygenase
VVSAAFTGLPMRTRHNRFTSEYGGTPTLPPMRRSNAVADIVAAAGTRADAAYYPMPAGESAGLIDDLPSAADVVAAIIEEARRVQRLLQP